MSDSSVCAATETTFDPRAFRRALGNFATGVTVVTAATASGRRGRPRAGDSLLERPGTEGVEAGDVVAFVLDVRIVNQQAQPQRQ